MPKPKLPDIDFEWSPNLAYVVGLLVTDGSLSKDGRHITFKSTDRSLAQIFKRILTLQNSITQVKDFRKNRKPVYVIQMGNVQFYRWLLRIGLFPLKTYTLGPIIISRKYFRDFLRGHLDGDGTIFTYRDTYNIYKGKRYINTRIYTKFISASKRHIHWLHEMIRKYSPVRGVLLFKKPKGRRVGMWEIKFSKYESLKLFHWLYYQANLPALKRKRDLAERFLSRVVDGRLIRI